MSAAGALAANISIKTRLGETFEYSDNQFMRTTHSGWSGGAFSTAALDLVARLPTWRFEGNADFAYQKYFGPAVAGFDSTESTSHGARLFAEHQSKWNNDREHVEWVYRRTNAGLAQLAETGFATAQGDLITYSLNGGLVRQVAKLDSVRLLAAAVSTSFDPANSGTPFIDLRTTGIWTRRLGPSVDFFVTSEFEYLSYDNAAKNQLGIIRETGGLEIRPTDRLTLKGSAGAILTKSFHNGVAATANPVTVAQPASNTFVDPFGTGATTNVAAFDPFASGTSSGLATSGGWSAGLVGDLSLNYKLKTGEVSLFAGQATAPSLLGDLQSSRWVGATARYDINRRESLSGETRFTQTLASAQGASESFSASATYNYQLTREWRSTLSYSYRHRTAASGNARANTVFFNLSHIYDVLPGT